jgi:GNAT superfamily N-acetyltransferase
LLIPSKLDFSRVIIQRLRPDHSFIDFDATETDGSDPTGLQEFIETEALGYQRENIGVTYVVLYESKIIAFYTVSMTHVDTDALSVSELVKIKKISEEHAKNIQVPYPAILLGRIAVSKPWRSKGIGKFIIDWVSGLAGILARTVGCRFVCLHCRKEKVAYYERHAFSLCEDRDARLKLMFKRIPQIPTNQ